MKTALINKFRIFVSDKRIAYSLQITQPEKLREVFKGKYSHYVNEQGTPTKALINLLRNGDYVLKDKIRAAVTLVPQFNK